MLRFLLLSASAAICAAGGYGGSGNGGGYGGSSRAASLGGSRSSDFGFNSAALNPVTGPVTAAVKTDHRVEYYDVPNEGSLKPTMVEVDSAVLPLTLMFRTHSSALNILHQHEGQAGGAQETTSEDEPHMLKHTVKKPVIQELYEVIAPVRKIVQEILPVQEEIQTIVARSVDHTTNAGLGGSFGMVGKSLGQAIRAKQIETVPFSMDNSLNLQENFQPQHHEILKNTVEQPTQNLNLGSNKITKAAKGTQKSSY